MVSLWLCEIAKVSLQLLTGRASMTSTKPVTKIGVWLVRLSTLTQNHVAMTFIGFFFDLSNVYEIIKYLLTALLILEQTANRYWRNINNIANIAIKCVYIYTTKKCGFNNFGK